MANYEKARIRLTKTELNKLKSTAKNKTGTTIRITYKNFQDEELPLELFLTTRQKTTIRNAFAKKMLISLKLIKVQISKLTQSVG